MQYYRLDIPKEFLFLCTEQSGEVKVSFSDAFSQIIEVTDNTAILQTAIEYSEDSFRHGQSLKLRDFIEQVAPEYNIKPILRFMLESMYNFSKYHNKFFVRYKLSVKKYLTDKIYPAYHQLETTLQLFSTATSSNIRFPEDESYPSRFSALNGKIYRTEDPCGILFSSFLIDFIYTLSSAGLEINECKVCGKKFCGKPGADCCANPRCLELIGQSSDDLRKTKITRTKLKFDDKIRHDKADLYHSGCPERAVDILMEYVKPLQEKVSKTAKALRRVNASLREIRAFEEETRSYYSGINTLKKKLLDEFATGMEE